MPFAEKVKTFINKVFNRDTRDNDDQQANDDEQPTTSSTPLARAQKKIKNMTNRLKSKRSRDNQPGDAPEAAVVAPREEVQQQVISTDNGITSAIQRTETRQPQAEAQPVAEAQSVAVAEPTSQAAQSEAVTKTAPQAAQEGTSSASKPQDVKNNGQEQRVMTSIPEEKHVVDEPPLPPPKPSSSSAPYIIDGNTSAEGQEKSADKNTAQ